MACVTASTPSSTTNTDTPINNFSTTALTTSPDVSHVLDDLFTLCRVPFVADFIFTPDAVADISMLTSPVQSEHAIAARIRSHTLHHNSSPSPCKHPCDYIQSPSSSQQNDLLFCTIPSFSVGPITVGFCTSKKIPSHATASSTLSSSLSPSHSSNTNKNTSNNIPFNNSQNHNHQKPPSAFSTASSTSSFSSSFSSTQQQYSSKSCDRPSGDASEEIDSTILESVGEQAQCNRFVRDDARGVFMVVAEDPSSGTILFDCMQHRSSRRRTRICARFIASKLRRAMPLQDHSSNPLLSAALLQLSVAYERRRCPLCLSSDSFGECTCVLPFRRPAHPLDFRHERTNMALYTGRYDGSTTLRMFSAASPNGVIVPYAVTALNSQSIIKGNTDRAVIKALTNSAVRQRLATLSVHPLPSAQPSLLSSPTTVALLAQQQLCQQQQQQQQQFLEYFTPQNSIPNTASNHQSNNVQRATAAASTAASTVTATIANSTVCQEHVMTPPQQQKTPLIAVANSPPASPSFVPATAPTPSVFLDGASTPNQSMLFQRGDMLDMLFSGLDNNVPDGPSTPRAQMIPQVRPPVPVATQSKPQPQQLQQPQQTVQSNITAATVPAASVAAVVSVNGSHSSCANDPTGLVPDIMMSECVNTMNKSSNGINEGTTTLPSIDCPVSATATATATVTTSNTNSNSISVDSSDGTTKSLACNAVPIASMPMATTLNNSNNSMINTENDHDMTTQSRSDESISERDVEEDNENDNNNDNYNDDDDNAQTGSINTNTNGTNNIKSTPSNAGQADLGSVVPARQTGRRGYTPEERAAKAEIRRQRNRMAAARSNIKRKLRNETLRKDLAEIQERAAVLRAQEKLLRVENVRLRSLAQQRQVSVGVHLTHICVPSAPSTTK